MTLPGYILLGVVVLVALFLNWLATYTLSPILQVPERTVPELDIEYEDLEIPSGAHRLAGWLLRPGVRPESEPLIILAHGWGATYGTVLLLGEPLAERGHDVLLFDIRGHGRNPQLPYVTIRDFRDDVTAAVRYAEKRFPGRKLLLVGHSMGGAGGVLAAAEGAPVDGLILIASPGDVVEVMSEYLDYRGMPGKLLVLALRPFWWPRVGGFFTPLTPTQRIAEIETPVMILQPEHDMRVARHHAEKLAAAAGMEYELVEDFEHTDVLTAPETIERVEAFLEEIRGPAAS